MTGYLAIVAIFFIFCNAGGQSPVRGLPFVRYFSTLEYKAGIQNWSLAQDRRGILYVANNLGLLEFDGFNWQVFSVNNGSKIRSVAVDPNGSIYVGCQGEFGFFFPDSRGQLQYTSLADSLPQAFRNFDETWSVYLDDDKVYFCTFSNLFIYRQGHLQVIQPEHAIELSFFVNRELLVSDRSTGLMKLQGDRLELVRGGDFFKGKSISAILPFFNNEYLISTFQDGIYLLNQSGSVKVWNPGQQKFFNEANINCLTRLKNGNFAVGTQNAGLLILDDKGESVLHLTSGHGLQNRTVLSLLEDDLQNLWVGNNNGISYVELGSPFTLINEEMGLPGTGYAAFLSEGNLYLGTNTGLYVRDLEDSRESFSLVEGTSGQVYHVGRYNNELLVGHHLGAMRVVNHKATVLSPALGSWVFATSPKFPNLLVEGTYAGIQLFSLQKGSWALAAVPGQFKESSRIMEFDREGDLWITHGYKGVFRLSLDRPYEISGVRFYGTEKGFPSNILINVYPIRGELVFTSERGIFRYDKSTDRFERDPFFTKYLGPDAQLWNISEDALGNIYFIGKDRIGVLRRQATGEYEIDLNSFNPIRRFLNDDLENLVILQNNDVLVGAKEGFIHYDPRAAVNRAATLRTHIRQVATHGDQDSTIFFGNHVDRGQIVQEQPTGEVIRLPYSQNSLTFIYAATSFESDEDVVHQTLLERFDKSWSHWTSQTQKEYTNLKEGTYIFRVHSRNVHGETSKETTYRFLILPPWYRTGWSLTGYVIGIFAMLFAAFMLIDRKYRKKQQAMAIQQERELILRDTELEALSQKSKEEITRLQNEKLEAELLHMNKELGTSTVLILNKNEFISGLKDNLKSLAAKGSQDGISKELSRIVHNIEGNLSSDTDWEHFQVYFDKVHGDFTRKFRSAFPDLSPQEMRLSAYLRMNLSTKEIAHLLNISIRGVEISRYRLRKKLGLERKLNLQEFILNF